MKCCVECFSSEYLRTIISTNSTATGTCDFCYSKNSKLYNPRELLLYFEGVLELYSLDSSSSSNSIEYKINEDFPDKIFKITETNIIRELLLQIIADDIDNLNGLFQSNVSLEVFQNPNTKNQAHDLELVWDNFVDEIKNENRFHVRNAIEFNKLEKLLRRHVREISKGRIFYRARISDKKGFDNSQMWNPPNSLAKAGRANPQGISYLYLASDVETTFFETRAILLDYISVGEFRLNESIRVINLRETELFDPIQLAEQDDLKDFIVHYPFISRLEKEISKPNRRTDNELDYIPTQYLSEFIKSLGFDGVEYRSSVNPIGYNLAIFTPNKFEIIKTYVNEINSVDFGYVKI